MEKTAVISVAGSLFLMEIPMQCTTRTKVYTDMAQVIKMKIIFFNCYLAAQQPTLGHYRGGSLTQPMLIIAFLQT